MPNETKRIVMLCPVGASLIGNMASFIEGKDEKDKDVHPGLGNEKRSTVELTEEKKIEIKKFGEQWLTKDKNGSGDGKTPRYPTAELQSIVLWQKDLKEPIDELELYLFPSDTTDSKATAFFIDHFLPILYEKNYVSKIKTVPVLHCEVLPINVSTEKEISGSIDALFGRYEKYTPKENKKSNIVINATGGYKAICAFSAIYAQVHGLRCIYTFEKEGTPAVELPSLPIGYALGALDDEVSILKALNGKQWPGKFDDACLPRWLAGLIEEEEDEDKNKNLKPSALADMLLKYYEENRFTAEAIGSGMLEQLTDEKLREYLKTCIQKNWSHLWIGDQIPETVEHSRRHSKRLMELAGNLYRNAREELEKMGMMEPQAIALLIAAIYLHDIGHTVAAHPLSEEERKEKGGVFPLGAFPSCVREVHHLLSGELIRDRKDELFPTPKNAEVTRAMFQTLVPYIAEHHRGYTRLKGKAAQPKEIIKHSGEMLYGDKFKETLLPLEKRLEAFTSDIEGWSLSIKDVLTVTALLRVLDGCDVQADRTVSEEYMKARLNRTQTEAEAIYWELKPLLSMKWKEYVLAIEKIRELSKELRVDDAVKGNITDSQGKALLDVCNDMYQKILRHLLVLKCVNGKKFLKLKNLEERSILSLLNRYAFKWEQFLHFYKHRCVGFVLPLQDEEGVVVYVWPSEIDSDPMKVAFKKFMEGEDGKGGDIEKEIRATDGLLKELNLRVKRGDAQDGLSK